MLLLCIAALLPLRAEAADAPAKPSVAVFALTAEFGVAEGVARLLTDNLAEVARQSAAFSRVTSSREIEAVLGFERQKQMMSCDSTSCMAELAGMLGVDMILVGSIGKLGTSFLLNLKLISVKTGAAVATLSERTRGTSEESLLDGVKPAMLHLLQNGKLDVDPAFVKAAQASAPSTSLADQTAASSAAGAPSSPLKIPLMVLGGIAVAFVPLLVIAAIAAVGGAVALAIVPYRIHVETPVSGTARTLFFPLSAGALGVLAGLAALLSLGLLGAGVGSLAFGATR